MTPTGKYRDSLLSAAYVLAGKIRRGKDGTLAFLDVVDTIFEEMEVPALDLEALLVRIRKWREHPHAGYGGSDGALEILCDADAVLTAALRRGGPEGVK